MENFPYVPSEPDKKTVLRRLRSAKASFSTELDNEIDRYFKQAKALFRPKGRACTTQLTIIDMEHICVNGQTVESALLTKLLSNSSKAYLMCATIPAREVDKISAAIQAGEGLKGLVLDAYASECVDGVLDVLMQRKNEALRRTGQKLTRHRFSAGYGDLDISYQKVFYDMLEMHTLDVHINEKYLLAPEKSVIAIAGVE